MLFMFKAVGKPVDKRDSDLRAIEQPYTNRSNAFTLSAIASLA